MARALIPELVSARTLRVAAPAEAAALIGVLVFAVAYVAIDWLALPRLFFLPLEDRIVLASHPSVPAIGYPGACLSAGLAALVAWGAAVRLLPRRAGSWVGLMTACSIVAAMAYFLWRNWP
jgi:hypothetical protein